MIEYHETDKEIVFSAKPRKGKSEWQLIVDTTRAIKEETEEGSKINFPSGKFILRKKNGEVNAVCSEFILTMNPDGSCELFYRQACTVINLDREGVDTDVSGLFPSTSSLRTFSFGR